MSERLLDLKLKRLIQLCKETGNYKKLAKQCGVPVKNLIQVVLFLSVNPVKERLDAIEDARSKPAQRMAEAEERLKND